MVPMTRPSLFAHLATRFGAQPELLATEALAFLLASSAAVRQAVLDVCAIAAPGVASVGDALQFHDEQRRYEASDEQLVGLDALGATRVVLNPRFWSALPDDQPARALRQLATHSESALLVLAPAERFTSLWAELRRRCRQAGLPVHGDHAVGDPIRWTKVGPHQTMILATWSALLAGARTRLLADGDLQTVTEIEQLAGLCEQMDAGAFLPLAPGELAGISARRLAQLFLLVGLLARNCQASGLCSLVDRDGISRPGFFGQQLRFSTTTLLVCLSVERWATLRETPFWLLVYDAEGQPARGVEARLAPLAAEIPPRLLRDAETGCPLVPLFPPMGVDREAVLADLERQVVEVARLLGEGPTAGFGTRT